MKNQSPTEFRAQRAALVTAAMMAASAITGRANVINDGGAPLADPVEYQVSASGATALGALTRGATTNSNNWPTGEQNGLWRLGTAQLRIGRTLYTSNAGAAQYIGLRDKLASTGNPNIDNIKTADRIVYQYHETGSINGILAVVKGGGLFLGGGNPFGNELPPEEASQSAPRWRMGWAQINRTTYIIDGNGNTSTNPGGYAAYEPPNVRIGYSDVRSFQAFAADDLPGTASPDRRPRNLPPTPGNENAGYGLGQKAYNPLLGGRGTNFQALANRSVIAGETGGDPGTSYLRNETLAIVPFAVAANPGTGLARLTDNEVRWLNGVGRLPNGANFNTVTREIGSGTRNQGTNNTDIDPSWGGGERDRRSLAGFTLDSYVDAAGVTRPITDVNGAAVSIRPGDEMRPDLDLFGVDSARPDSQQPKEHRIGPLMRFSDKNSGGSGVRPTVVNNRMAISPNISVGDVGDRGLMNLDGSIPSAARTDPMRVLKIDWAEQHNAGLGEDDTGPVDDGFVQPTAYNVTNGRYQMWSAAQAVTVIGIDTNGDGKPDRRGTVAEDQANPNKLIWGDTFEQTDASSVGIHRKFLNNIRQSVSNYPSNAITPADAVIDAGFIPAQVMKVSKEFDGGTQTWSNAPAGFDQSLYDLLVANDPPLGARNLKSRLNWIDPSTDPINGGTLGFNGDVANGQVRYRIFALDVPVIGSGSSTPTKQITITARTVLAGDMDGNGVRDIQDVEELAQAYAASEALGNINGTAPVGNVFGSLSSDDLIVLTDFNGSGNIDPASTNAAPVFRAMDRDDVAFFLKGATIDTISPNPTTGYAGSSNIQIRREDGVRLGKLKKNQAIDTFNATLQALVGTARPFGGGNWSQAQIDALKLHKGDVNNDGQVSRADARELDALIGVAPYSLTLEQVLVNYNIDPIYAELTDDDIIDHVDPDGAGGPLLSDMQVLRGELGVTSLIDGDANFDGRVDSRDLYALASHWNSSVDRWSMADFNFDGLVDLIDMNLMVLNWQQSGSPPALWGQWGQTWASLGGPGIMIPEPAGLLLPASGGLLCLGRSRSRRRRRAV
ncbi:dockerin type I domain-containing protein [Fontivita pretiosa]|uniref:dockerin type I domain-containing protein n=1 Tax=Fontivita pretiosa TaxID=2989684 RepID=UPI003D17398F